MAISTNHGFAISASGLADPTFARHSRRRISPQASRAIRLLGHAIEYLANEFLHDSHPPNAQKERLQAVRMLMALNSEVYSECPEMPEAPSFQERCRQFLAIRRG